SRPGTRQPKEENRFPVNLFVARWQILPGPWHRKASISVLVARRPPFINFSLHPGEPWCNVKRPGTGRRISQLYEAKRDIDRRSWMKTKGEQFAGVTVALITPFRDGEIDFGELNRLVDWHVQQGTDCLSPV